MVGVAALCFMPTPMQRSISNGGGTHRCWTWRVCISGPLKRQLEEGLCLSKIYDFRVGEDVNGRLLEDGAGAETFVQAHDAL